MASIDDVRRLVALDHGLAHLSTLRADGSVHATVVNAGVIDHPVSGAPTVAFVCRPGTSKLANLRARPAATASWRAGWAWATVEGAVEIVGPDDALDGVSSEDIAGLLRCIYVAAGGEEHQDWPDYDRVMATERRVAVLVTPRRIYVNP